MPMACEIQKAGEKSSSSCPKTSLAGIIDKEARISYDLLSPSISYHIDLNRPAATNHSSQSMSPNAKMTFYDRRVIAVPCKEILPVR
jgi:hypothetical protein